MQEQNIVYKQIVDDYVSQITHQIAQSSINQHQYQQHKNQSNILNQQNFHSQSHQQQYKNYQQNTQKPQKQQQINPIPPNSSSSPHSIINNHQLGKYSMLQSQQQESGNIKISISKVQKRGSIVNSYYVYFIQGKDQKGSFSLARRFNQFYQMRSCMVIRWPGCCIPSIPAKNIILKNDIQIVQRRKRYLNSFVRKIAQLTHLYYGEQFQTLLRSQQTDISTVFSKWPIPSTQSIINKYRINFSELAGKQINYETNQKINNFVFFIRKNQPQLQKDRQSMKKLAQSNDKLNYLYSQLFTRSFITYQTTCLSQYCSNKQSSHLYLNPSQIKLQQHCIITSQITRYNPFWLYYDMIRHQQRDGLAFLQSLQSKSKYDIKRNSLEIKILQNQKIIHQLSIGKRSMSIAGFNNNKSSNEEIIIKLESQIEEYKREKQNIAILTDIVLALIAYIQIERYKHEKYHFYQNALIKIGANQINKVQSLGEVWESLREASKKRLNQQQ